MATPTCESLVLPSTRLGLSEWFTMKAGIYSGSHLHKIQNKGRMLTSTQIYLKNLISLI